MIIDKKRLEKIILQEFYDMYLEKKLEEGRGLTLLAMLASLGLGAGAMRIIDQHKEELAGRLGITDKKIGDLSDTTSINTGVSIDTDTLKKAPSRKQTNRKPGVVKKAVERRPPSASVTPAAEPKEKPYDLDKGHEEAMAAARANPVTSADVALVNSNLKPRTVNAIQRHLLGISSSFPIQYQDKTGTHTIKARDLIELAVKKTKSDLQFFNFLMDRIKPTGGWTHIRLALPENDNDSFAKSILAAMDAANIEIDYGIP
jgi:hypothetical protein